MAALFSWLWSLLRRLTPVGARPSRGALARAADTVHDADADRRARMRALDTELGEIRARRDSAAAAAAREPDPRTRALILLSIVHDAGEAQRAAARAHLAPHTPFRRPR
jgi:hypothetical protein